MILFMLFIVVLVTLMIKRSNEDALIDRDYYEKGQAYDSDFQAKQNADADDFKPRVNAGEDGLNVSFLTQVRYRINLKRPSDNKLDKRYDSTFEESSVFVPYSDLAPGLWFIRIDYERNSRKYLFEDKVMIP